MGTEHADAINWVALGEQYPSAAVISGTKASRSFFCRDYSDNHLSVSIHILRQTADPLNRGRLPDYRFGYGLLRKSAVWSYSVITKRSASRLEERERVILRQYWLVERFANGF